MEIASTSNGRHPLDIETSSAGSPLRFLMLSRNIQMLKRFILRLRMKRAMKNGRRISLADAARLWGLSNTIYMGPVGPSASILPEYEIFRILAEDRKIEDAEIRELLSHPSPGVAGYGLEMLIRRNAAGLDEAAAALSGRQELVTKGLTSFVCYVPLSEYAARRVATASHPIPTI